MSQQKRLRKSSSYAAIALTPALLGAPRTVKARPVAPQTMDRTAERPPMGAAAHRLLQTMLALSPAEKLRIGGDRIRLTQNGCVNNDPYSCNPDCPTISIVTDYHCGHVKPPPPGRFKSLLPYQRRIKAHTKVLRPKTGPSKFVSTPDKLHKTLAIPSVGAKTAPPSKLR